MDQGEMLKAIKAGIDFITEKVRNIEQNTNANTSTKQPPPEKQPASVKSTITSMIFTVVIVLVPAYVFVILIQVCDALLSPTIIIMPITVEKAILNLGYGDGTLSLRLKDDISNEIDRAKDKFNTAMRFQKVYVKGEVPEEIGQYEVPLRYLARAAKSRLNFGYIHYVSCELIKVDKGFRARCRMDEKQVFEKPNTSSSISNDNILSYKNIENALNEAAQAIFKAANPYLTYIDQTYTDKRQLLIDINKNDSLREAIKDENVDFAIIRKGILKDELGDPDGAVAEYINVIKRQRLYGLYPFPCDAFGDHDFRTDFFVNRGFDKEKIKTVFDGINSIKCFEYNVNPIVYNNLGELYYRYHKLDRAERMFRNALKLDDNYMIARYGLCATLNDIYGKDGASKDCKLVRGIRQRDGNEVTNDLRVRIEEKLTHSRETLDLDSDETR